MESSTSRPIVVVDDNTDDLFFFKRGLTKAGIGQPVAVAEDGEEAITLLKGTIEGTKAKPAQIPLIVFLDLKMPRVSGFGVLQWMRTQRALDAVPVAILSSSAEPSDVSKAYASGAQTYLVKHPTPQDIAAAIAAASQVKGAEDLKKIKLPGLARPK